MSAKTIAAYQARLVETGRAPKQTIDVTGVSHRTARTTPPPAPSSAGNDVIVHAEALIEAAQRILSRADELVESAARMGATKVCVSRYAAARKEIR